MIDALRKHAPKGARWNEPIGGFFVLMELAGEIDTRSFYPKP